MHVTCGSTALVFCMKKPQHQLRSFLFLELLSRFVWSSNQLQAWMTFPQHMALKDFLIFPFPQNSITHCCCNLVYGSLKRAQLHSYCSLELSFLTPLLCLWRPLPLICCSLNAVHLSLDIGSLYKVFLLLWQLCSHGGATKTAPAALNWSTCSQACTVVVGGGGGFPGMSSVKLCVCARETKSRIPTRALLWVIL